MGIVQLVPVGGLLVVLMVIVASACVEICRRSDHLGIRVRCVDS